MGARVRFVSDFWAGQVPEQSCPKEMRVHQVVLNQLAGRIGAVTPMKVAWQEASCRIGTSRDGFLNGNLHPLGTLQRVTHI